MRMWMVDPKILCTKHLLGEHVETHMFAGSILKGTSMQGYVDAGLLEGAKLAQRHEDLVAEMTRRGMKHRSSFPRALPMLRLFAEAGGRVDEESARAELLLRCPRCVARALDPR